MKPQNHKLLQIEGLTKFLERFAHTFVQPDFRQRFVHEAIKRPERLNTKISHSIENVFPSIYLGMHVSFNPDTYCVPICGTKYDLKDCLWRDLSEYVDRGVGILISSADASQFYAETETELRNPYKIYSGSKI